MIDIKEKFRNLIEEENLKINGGPFVVKNFLKNVEDYLNWNTLNEAINTDIVDWRLIELEMADKNFIIPWKKPYWTGIRQQDKQFIIEHVNKGSTFIVDRCCILNDNFKSLISGIQEVFHVASDLQIYGSKGTNSKSFLPHSDFPKTSEIFIIQAIGDTDWIVFKNRRSNLIPYSNDFPKREELTPDLEVTLSPGDLLYVPPRTYHIASPSAPRLSMTIPCINIDYDDLRGFHPDFDNPVGHFIPDVNKYEF